MLTPSHPSLAQLCEAVAEAYQTRGLPYSAALQPALSESEMAAQLGPQLALAPELAQLYRWRNGSAPEEVPFPLAGKPFLSLQSALSQRQVMLAALHPKDREEPSLQGLFPFAGEEPEWYAMVPGDPTVFLVVEDAKPDFESLEALLGCTLDWVGQPDWRPDSPPREALDIWYRHNPSLHR